jgi:hypothetical protein
MDVIKTKKPKFFGLTIFSYLILPTIISFVSAYHVLHFFELSNSFWMAFILALAFEAGSLAALAGLITLDKISGVILWLIFITLTVFQCHGNIYFAYDFLSQKMVSNPHLIDNWCHLWGMTDMDQDDIIFAKRMISYLTGGLLPPISLGFLHFAVTYIKKTVYIDNVETVPEIKKEEEIKEISIVKEENIEENNELQNTVNLDNIANELRNSLLSKNKIEEINIENNVTDPIHDKDLINLRSLRPIEHPEEKLELNFNDFEGVGLTKLGVYLELLKNLFHNGEAKINDELLTFTEFKEKCEKGNIVFSLDVYKDFLTICNYLQITDLRDGKRTALINYEDAIKKLTVYLEK